MIGRAEKNALDISCKRQGLKWIWFCAAISLTLFIVFCYLFYYQIVCPEQFPSDIRDHIEIAKRGTGYSALYFLMRLIIGLPGHAEYSVIAIIESLIVIITIYLMMCWIRRVFHLRKEIAFLIGAGCVFLSSLYIPIIHPFFYRNGIVTQSWHNITYLGMRLGAILTIIGITESLETYQKKLGIKEWGLVAIPAALATSIKPSFLLAFSWTLFLFLVFDLIRGKFNPLVLLSCFKMGTTIFPALIVLFLQSRLLYGSGSSGIGFSLFSSSFFMSGFKETAIKLICSLAFPILVFVYHKRLNCLRRIEYFLLVEFMVGFFQVIVFTETGPRSTHGNFYWTIYICGFLFFGSVVSRFLCDSKQIICFMRKTENRLVLKDLVYIVCGSLLMAWHLLSGIAYYWLICRGGTYLI